jgi:Leucine-rich repeat (LRR) protein
MKEGTSSISDLPIELFGHTLTYVPLKEHLSIRNVNKKWHGIFNCVMAHQMSSLGLQDGIHDATKTEEFNTLWQNQNKEINILLKSKETILNKINNAPIVIKQLEQLKLAQNLSESTFALHAREKILNKINETIILLRLEQTRAKFTKKLDCANCSLTRFPASVLQNARTCWQELLLLSFANNHLTSLPEELGKCVALQWLCLDNNKICILPESIGECASLLELSAAHNDLTTLPASITRCPTLKMLDVDNNHISVLPENMNQCPALEYLFVDDNHLVALPENIGSTALLQKLFVNRNYLTSLPDSVSERILYDIGYEPISKSKVLASQNEVLKELSPSMKKLKISV